MAMWVGNLSGDPHLLQSCPLVLQLLLSPVVLPYMMTGVTGGNLAVQGWLDVALFHPIDGIVFDCISAKKKQHKPILSHNVLGQG